MHKEYKEKLISLEKAVGLIKSGDRIVTTTGCSVPAVFLNKLAERKEELENVNVYTQLPLYPFNWLSSDYIGHIHLKSSFMSGIERKAIGDGNVSLYSYQFSKTNQLLDESIKPTVLVAQVTPPDDNGNMSLGAMGPVWGKHSSKLADTVILQVNKNQPFLCGGEESFINVKEADYIFECDSEVATLANPTLSEDDERIANFVIPFIKDGSTIQLGLGSVANAIGAFLKDHKHLGVHSEMFTDSMMELVKLGVIDNSRKTINPGKSTIAFTLGSRELYDFMDKNQDIDAREINYVANPNVVAEHDNFVSINSCLSCDLTGQVASESIGYKQFSATGGQLDFVRGAGLSKGGRSILCMNSVAKKKDGSLISKISTSLDPGTAVTTPRTDVDCIVTEYGIAQLKYLDFDERARALIEIAHPDFREELYNDAIKNGIIIKK